MFLLAAEWSRSILFYQAPKSDSKMIFITAAVQKSYYVSFTLFEEIKSLCSLGLVFFLPPLWAQFHPPELDFCVPDSRTTVHFPT